MSDAEVAAGLATTEDAFLGGRLSILQPVDGHRAGVDAVLMAAAVRSDGAAARALEAGSGTGIASLALAARLSGVDVSGVEIEPALVALARRNAERNGLAGRVRFVEADVTAPARAFASLGLAPDSFDVVMANPPFLAPGRHRSPPQALRDRAMTMPAGGLTAWLGFLARMARPRGWLTLIHRADSLAEVLAACEGRFGDLAVTPIHPRAEEPAIRVLIEGRKGSRGALTVRPGLVLHRREGGFTPAIEAVLRGGAALDRTSAAGS